MLAEVFVVTHRFFLSTKWYSFLEWPSRNLICVRYVIFFISVLVWRHCFETVSLLVCIQNLYSYIMMPTKLLFSVQRGAQRFAAWCGAVPLFSEPGRCVFINRTGKSVLLKGDHLAEVITCRLLRNFQIAEGVKRYVHKTIIEASYVIFKVSFSDLGGCWSLSGSQGKSFHNRFNVSY